MSHWFVSWEYLQRNGDLLKSDFVFTGEEPDNPAQLINHLKSEIARSNAVIGNVENIIFVAFNRI